MVLFLISLSTCSRTWTAATFVAAPAIAKEFNLSKTSMGLVFSAFLWAYAIGQDSRRIPGGPFGPRRVLLAIILLVAYGGVTGLTTGVVTLMLRVVLG